MRPSFAGPNPKKRWGPATPLAPVGAPTCLSEQARHLIFRQLINELVKLDAIYGNTASVRRWADSQEITRGPKPYCSPQAISRFTGPPRTGRWIPRSRRPRPRPPQQARPGTSSRGSRLRAQPRTQPCRRSSISLSRHAPPGSTGSRSRPTSPSRSRTANSTFTARSRIPRIQLPYD